MSRIIILASPGSGHGKTLVTAGLAKALGGGNRRIRVYKMGPDYLDPQFIEAATGLEVRQLDYWMLGEREIAAELCRAQNEVDDIIIEGVMGLFDGEHSVARLARDYRIPVCIVADASAMAQTFGALMYGLANYDPDVNVAAVIANKVGSDRHASLLAESVRPPLTMLGSIKRDKALAVHERHLGIGAEDRSAAQHAAAAMAEQLTEIAQSLPWGKLRIEEDSLTQPEVQHEGPRLQGMRIAVAKDAVFSFIYHANMDFLQREGATVHYFSPLSDTQLPDCDALYLPGGYPELHLETLANNHAMISAIRQHIEADKPCMAECGGMLYLLESLSHDERCAPLCGIFPLRAKVNERLAGLGYQSLPGTRLRGHSFHYASIVDEPSNADELPRSAYSDDRKGELILREKRTIASFVHWYFSSEPQKICDWLSGKPEL